MFSLVGKSLFCKYFKYTYIHISNSNQNVYYSMTPLKKLNKSFLRVELEIYVVAFVKPWRISKKSLLQKPSCVEQRSEHTTSINTAYSH